jgi:enoyl-CoA hydratase
MTVELMDQVVSSEIKTQNLINYYTDDGLAIIEMDNAPANTYSHEMFREMDEAILQARMDDSVHVIVIRGKG